MCIVDNFEPLSKVKNNRPENFISDLINEIKLESNISFEYIFTQNFEESYKLLNENKCEVIPFVENSYNKLDKYSFTKPYLSLSMVAIGKKDKEFFSDLSELKNKKISILSTLNISDELKIKYPNLKIVKVKDSNEALELLKSNQVYAHLTFYPIAKDIVLKNNGDNLKIIGRLVKTVDISMLTKKENEILNSILDKLLLNISPTKINALINKWSDVKIKKVIDYGFIFKLLILFFLILIFGYWRYRIIKNSKEEFEAIFKFSKDGIVIVDLNGYFINFNNAFLNIIGYEKNELLKLNYMDIIFDDDKKKMNNIFKSISEKNQIDNLNNTLIGKYENEILTNITISLMPDKKRILFTIKDISSLKILEAQSKLASMGEMIGNIAHQWRQPLSVITTCSTGLLLKSDIDDKVSSNEIKEFSEQITQQAQYLSRTIDDFRNFIKDDLNFVNMSLKESLEKAIILTKAAMSTNYINIVAQIEDDLFISGNKNELSQAFINILNNSKDKLKEIDENLQDRYIFIKTKKISENEIEIEIFDNGGGINEKIIDRIFEPYFTTKHKSLGTGLGLSMSDKIIRERHNGKISVRNKDFEYKNKSYKGASFKIRVYSTNKTLSLD